ncbi:MAG: O-antigen/teichoic acid export membrane protein [Flammeovirgaceae bacterium]|jgi:O-antigen/teichoic acid export membrane protein
MFKDVKNTFKQTLIYGMSNLSMKAAGLILIPFYTGSLSTNDYGQLLILEVLAQFAIGIVSFQVPSALLRLGSNLSNIPDQKKLYSTSLGLVIILSALFALIAFPFAEQLSQLIFSSPDFKIHFELLTFSIIFEVLGLIPLQLLRLKEKSVTYLLLVSLKLITLVGLVWYFVVLQEEGVYGAVKAIIYSNLVFLISTIPIQVKNISPKFSVNFGIQIYKYSGPLIFTTVAALLLTLSDRLIIKIFGQFEDVGIYGLAYKIGSLSNLLIITSFSLGFLPIAYKKFTSPDFKPFFSKTLTLYLGLTILLTLVISVFGEELTKILSSGESAYWAAGILVPFIAYIFIFKAMNNYFLYVFLLTKKTKHHATVTVIGVLLNIALNFILIPRFGIYGAVAATGVSYLVMTILSYSKAQKLVHVDYEIRRIIILLISCAIIIAMGISTNEISLFPRLLLKSILILSYLIFIYRFIITDTEREMLRDALNKVSTTIKSSLFGS